MWESTKIWESSSFAKEQYSMLYKTQLQAYEQTTIKKKKKKKKVSPKKPLNSYAAFYRDNFETLRAENPELNVQEIAKLMGSRWKGDTAARERYSNLRKSQMAAFEDTSTATASSSKNNGQPKKPLNSYASYYRDNFEALRAENPELNVQEIAKLMGSRWKADTAARERYSSMRKTQMQAFVENASLTQTVDETGAVTGHTTSTGAPKKPLNSYAAYYRDNFESLRAENPGLNVQEIAKLMGSRWKADTAARERYGMIRKAQMQTYEENQRQVQGYEQNVMQMSGSGEPAAQKPQQSSSGVEMPKKPLNAYASYYQDHFESLRAENPGLTTKEISKIASYRWKADSANRKKYTVIYKAQMAAYKERPPPPFNSYYQDIFETLRAQNPDLDVLALTKLADQMWKADTATKEKYTMLYKIQLQAYYEKLKQQGLYRFPQ